MFYRNENFKQYINAYPVVSTIIALNLVVYVLTLIPLVGDIIFYGGMSVNNLIAQGEWWRIVTSMFLHAGFFHLAFNVFSIYLFGPELEQLAGKLRFLTIYLLSGIGGEALTFITQQGDYASVGASGAIFGILGAFGAIVARYRHVTTQLRQIILPFIIISVILTFLQPNTNASSHIGGLITGFVLGLFYFTPQNFMRWRNKKTSK